MEIPQGIFKMLAFQSAMLKAQTELLWVIMWQGMIAVRWGQVCIQSMFKTTWYESGKMFECLYFLTHLSS